MTAYCVCIAGLCSRRARVSVVSRAAVRPRASIAGRGRAVSIPCDYRGRVDVEALRREYRVCAGVLRVHL